MEASGTVYGGPPSGGGTIYGGPHPSPAVAAGPAFRGTFEIGKVLSESFSVYFSNFIPFVLLTALALFPLYLVQAYMTIAKLEPSSTAVGTLLLWLVSSTPNVWTTAGSCLVVGLGLGLVATPTLIAAQASVPWNERAVVTGTNMFMRSVGSAVGVAIFGAVANAVIASRGGDASGEAVRAGSAAVFLGVLVAALVSIAAGLLMPHTRAEDVAHGGDEHHREGGDADGPDAADGDGHRAEDRVREPSTGTTTA